MFAPDKQHNRQRIKNGLQLHNEGAKVQWIKAERAKQKQEATYPKEGQKGFQPTNVVQSFAPHETGKTRDQVASAIGLGSGEQARKLDYVAKNKPEILPQIKPQGIRRGVLDKEY